MKNLFILASIFLFSYSSISQGYHPIIKNNKYWDQCHTTYYTGCYPDANRFEFIDGETYHDGVAYRNSNAYPFLGTPGPNSTICPPFSISNNPNQFAQMREDTVARKVFIYDYNSTPKDQLLYDFTINIGDTLKSTYAGQGTILVLKSIETISLANGDLRQKYCFDDQCTISYIEEIGGRNGLFQPIIPIYIGYDPLLLCVQENGQILFGNECDTYFMGIEHSNQKPFMISPNPFNDCFTITINMIELPVYFKIIDFQGKIVVNQKLNEKKSKISVSNLIQGMYYYVITTDKSNNRGKLIKY